MTDELTRKRMAILNTKGITTMAVELFALAFQNSGNEAIGVVAREVFRPYKFYTNVARPGVSSMHGLYFRDDPENQWLGGPVDLWEFSTYHVQEMVDVFLKERGLKGKTHAQIQDYLDDNGISMPDVPRLELPSLEMGSRIRITGTFDEVTGFSVLGHVPTSPIVRGRRG